MTLDKIGKYILRCVVKIHAISSLPTLLIIVSNCLINHTKITGN